MIEPEKFVLLQVASAPPTCHHKTIPGAQLALAQSGEISLKVDEMEQKRK
ncbi:MAG TPA: hypothetical protein VJ987_03400 [Anaerolineales bacterium]|nr:hypothetical protein [Anaerolineales bacterium]